MESNRYAKQHVQRKHTTRQMLEADPVIPI